MVKQWPWRVREDATGFFETLEEAEAAMATEMNATQDLAVPLSDL